MKKYIKSLFSIIFLFLFDFGYSQIKENNLSNRIANYDIKVELNPDTKTLNGSLILNWTNTSTDSIDELQFHLYLNAFKNTNSTFMKEYANIFSVFDINFYENMWGWIDIISMKIVDGETLTDKLTYIQPDDYNTDDQTVVSTSLTQKIFPNQTIEIEISFVAKLPKIIARSGYSDDYFFVAQWFPKIGVLEFKGIRNAEQTQWNCHQYHSNSEFYADFGVYNVNITLPENYVVGATGFLNNKTINGDGTKTLSYNAKDVIDFAWTASPKYTEYEKVWKGTIIKALMLPEHNELAYRHINSAIKAIDYFEANVGEYPYPNLTIVDVPFTAQEAGGMEYPMFISTISFSNLPIWLKLPELVTIHEFGHNYFMAVLATNEFEEAWLDEGINSYYEAQIMKDNFPTISFLGYNFEDEDISRAGYTLFYNPQITTIDNFAWKFPDNSYGILNYNKPATVLKTLENLIGKDYMTKAMKTYFERWKFKHPTASDFIATINEVFKTKKDINLGDNMDWFFQQTIYNTYICDYQLSSITNTEAMETTEGVFDKGGVKLTIVPETENYVYQSVVQINRNGEMKIPVEILVHFENGDEKIEYWDGQASFKTLYYTNANKIEWAKVDYLDKITLDVNRNNNSFTINPNPLPAIKYSSKFLFWLQNLIQFFGFII